MSRSVSIDAMYKISYCLTYHSFLFYISKLLFVTVILYFCIHFHLAPVEGLFFKPKYRANILCICFNFIAVSFLFLSSPWGSVYRFCEIKLVNPIKSTLLPHANHRTKESFVSTTNKPLVDTLMTIGDVTVSIAINKPLSGLLVCRLIMSLAENFTFALEASLLGQMFIFRTISQSLTLSADIPAAWRGLFTPEANNCFSIISELNNRE